MKDKEIYGYSIKSAHSPMRIALIKTPKPVGKITPPWMDCCSGV
jgi:hypothetical protein